MIDEQTRTQVFQMAEQGAGSRRIARELEISRPAVQRILASRSPKLPVSERASRLEPHLEKIRTLYAQCKGNLVRVAEELTPELDEPIGYSTLTAFCRAQGFGAPRLAMPAGQYVTGPGVEMQHDTSPVRITVGNLTRTYQAASLKLGFSRVRFLAFYRRFRRFECKDFLTQAFVFFGGLCRRCVIDNTSVIVAYGSGPEAVMAPEMQAFEKRFGFHFWAHRIGDANRSAKVERDFDFIQRNFLAGRTFRDDADLYAQALRWCQDKNQTANSHSGQVPSVLLDEERPHLKPLPVYVPPVYQLHERTVDAYGLVSLDKNLYSAPPEMLGKLVTLRETMDTLTLLDGPRILCRHDRLPDGERQTSRLPEHKRTPRPRQPRKRPFPERDWLLANSPYLADYVRGLERVGTRRLPYQLRKLYALCHEYPQAEVERLAAHAATYNLFDAARLEAMLLQQLGAKLFGLPPTFAQPPASGNSTRPPGHVTLLNSATSHQPGDLSLHPVSATQPAVPPKDGESNA